MIFRVALNLLLIVTPLMSAPQANAAVDSARAAYDAGRFSEAHTILAKEAGTGSTDASVYYLLARCDLELREYDEMIAHAERAVELSPDNSDYHLLLGRAYGRKAEHHSNWFSGLSLAKKIHQEFERAVELNPRNLKAQRDLANYYARAPGIVGGGEDKAQRKLEEIQALDPIQGHLARMDYFVEKKQWEQAAAECKIVESSNPRTADPYNEVLEYYESREDAAALENALELASHNGASDPRFDYYRGAAAAISGEDFASGESALKRYIRSVVPRSGLPSQSNAHVWLGKIYDKQHQHDAAIAEYREALKLDSNNKTAKDALKHANQ